MIVYRCKCCSKKYIFTCDNCQGYEFLKENLNVVSPEEIHPSQLQLRYFGSEPNDAIGKVRGREMSNIFSQREQIETEGKKFFFTQESKVRKCHTNEEVEESDFCTQPTHPLAQKQLLKWAGIECHKNEDANASNVHSRCIELEEQLSDHFRNNQTALNAILPEIQKTWDPTQISHSTTMENHRKKDAKISNFRNEYISLEKEQVCEQFNENRSVFNMSQILITEDQTQTSHSQTVEYNRNEVVEASNFSSQQINLELENPLSPFCKNNSELDTSSPMLQNAWSEVKAWLAEDNDAKISSNFNCFADSTSLFRENQNNPLNYFDQLSNTEPNNQSDFKMMLEKQITSESSRIDRRDGTIDSSRSSSFRSWLPESVPENFIADHNVRHTQNTANNCSAELFRKRGNPSTETTLQLCAHSSEKLTKLEDAENHPIAYAPPAEYSASPTTNPSSESARECSRNVEKEISFPIHAYDKQILLKGDHTPNVFHHESSVREHRVIPVDERPFKCDHCGNTAKTKMLLKSHMLKWHHSLFSNRELNCSKCLWQFVASSKSNVDVPSNNYDPKDIKCDLCSEEFYCEHKLNHHYNTVHKGEKRFKCNKCPHASTSRQNLIRHQNTIHKK